MILLSKVRSDGSILLFNSATKTGINFELNLDQSFQEILYRIDIWINDGSGWIIDEIHNQYLNVSSCSPLIGSTYVKLPDELKHSRKGLTNIQNDDNKCFLWCHVRHLNFIDKNPQRIASKDREFVKNLNYESIDFPVSKKDYGKIEMFNKIGINVFCDENKVVYPVYLSDQSDCIDLLNMFMFNKTKHRGKNTFVRVVYSVLAVKMC